MVNLWENSNLLKIDTNGFSKLNGNLKYDKKRVKIKIIKRVLHTFSNLTVTVRAGSRLPKSSKMVITAEMSKIAQK